MTLKDLRRAVPMEQRELAEKIGVSTLTISSWETGRRRPKPAHIRKLADVLNVNMKKLLLVLDRTKTESIYRKRTPHFEAFLESEKGEPHAK